MEYSIFVSGDYQITSKNKSLKQIHLILSDGHFTVDKTKFQRRKHVAREDKKILMYEFKEGEINCFDGDEESSMSKEFYDDVYSNPITSDWILVKRDFIAETKKMDLVDSYHTYLKMADKMKEETDGYINFYRCGSVKDMALNLFYDKVKCIFPDEISNIEAEYINDASFSALTLLGKIQRNCILL
jgi:hypothetical protein